MRKIVSSSFSFLSSKYAKTKIAHSHKLLICVPFVPLLISHDKAYIVLYPLLCPIHAPMVTAYSHTNISIKYECHNLSSYSLSKS